MVADQRRYEFREARVRSRADRGPGLSQHGTRGGSHWAYEDEEKNSVATASKEAFDGCTKTFANPRFCAAIVDRLTFGRQHHRDQHRLLPPRPEPEPPPPPEPAPTDGHNSRTSIVLQALH
jgi:hypothetical protein